MPKASRSISRRSFLQAGLKSGAVLAASAAGALLPAVALTGCNARETADNLLRNQRSWTDDMGRALTIPTPDVLERVYFTSPLAQTFVFSVNPDVMAGVSSRFTEEDLRFLPARLGELPSMGSLSGGMEIDREALIARDVQLMLSISGAPLTEANRSDAEKLQDQTGIPVVLIDGSFDKTGDAYRKVGDILGRPERGEELASYLEGILADVTGAVAGVPEAEKVSLYYAEGPLGLQTEPPGGQHALTFDLAGARNVAEVAESIDLDLGMSNVSLEQVLVWDPQVIIAWGADTRGGADERIRTNAEWSAVRAVADGRVYTMPDVPFAWCDRPIGPNRFMGLMWVANMLYPQRYDVDMVERVREFYRTMYAAEVDEAAAIELLGNSYPPRKGK